jgi:hypothetical protein
MPLMPGVRWIQAALIGAAACAAVVPLDPGRVERWFSTGFYPPLQQGVTALSNMAPFALLDLIVVAVAVGLVALVWRAWRLGRTVGRRRAVLEAIRTASVTAAVCYLAFLFLWGFNYRRVPMADRLAVQEAPLAPGEVVELGLEAARHLNELHGEAHRTGWQGQEWEDAGLREAFTLVQAALSDAPPARVGRLKPTLFAPYFRWTSVDGMVNPFALEVIANPGLLPFERPFLAAHEWAHLAGFAHESDANFVAWLTCLQGPVPAQYSGWLFVYWQVQAEVGPRDRARIRERLAPGPRADLQAITTRVRRGQVPALRRASWMAYDRYLRANRVEEGVRNYGAVLTLILRARLDDDRMPLRRALAPVPPPHLP